MQSKCQDNKKVSRAKQYATLMHSGQKRRDGAPYIEHPIRVFEQLVDLGITDENILCAALLHDTLEDTKATPNEISKKFGPVVLKMVQQLTTDNSEIQKLGLEQFEAYKNGENFETSSLVHQFRESGLVVDDETMKKRMGKALYLAKKMNGMIENDRDSLLVKLSDRLDNLLDAQKLEDKQFLKQYCLETEFIIHKIHWYRLSASLHSSLLIKIVDALVY